MGSKKWFWHIQTLVHDPAPFVPQQFSSDIADNASTVCLAHLFTYQDFDEGTLGLAYVAPSKAQALGGLCPKRKDSIACYRLLFQLTATLKSLIHLANFQ